jgi:hypothetical protein
MHGLQALVISLLVVEGSTSRRGPGSQRSEDRGLGRGFRPQTHAPKHSRATQIKLPDCGGTIALDWLPKPRSATDTLGDDTPVVLVRGATPRGKNSNQELGVYLCSEGGFE